MGQNKPNFFIVGAAKAGTTSLYEYLKQHPDIYFSPVKEPNYFSTDIDTDQFSSTYRKNTILDTESYFSQYPLPTLQLTFVRKSEHYRRLFEEVNNEQAIGEASTSYLFSTEAAANIYHYNPNARILAILRNPVRRAYSHYLMALRYGHTDMGFYEAIKTDYQKTNKGWGISELFIELGLYFRQLKRYYDIFPPHQIKVLLFDDLVSRPEKVLQECYNFLGVEQRLPDSFASFNQAQVPRHKSFNKLMTQWGIKKILKNYLPHPLQEKIKSKLFSIAQPGKEIDGKSEAFLHEIYDEDILKTSRLIEKDLSGWLKD